MAGESKLQTKILEWLKQNGFWCIKVIVSSHAGTMDIIACSPKGRFVGVEVKYGANKPSALQSYHIKEVVARNGIAFVAWDLQTVIYKLSGELTSEKPKEQQQPVGKFLL